MTPAIPRVGLGVFVLNRAGQLVLGKRKGSHGAGTWQLPGGHLNYGESFEQCAEREVMEETSLKIKDIRFLTATNDVMEEEGKHYVTIFMICSAQDENAKVEVMEPDKCEVWEWVRWNDLRTSEQDRQLFSPLISLFQQRPGLVLSLAN